MREARPRKKGILLPLLLLGWGGCVVGGFGFAAVYQNRPGEPAKPPSTLRQAPEKPELLVFIHPQCPCSRATLSELERLTAQTGSRLDTQVYVFAPKTQSRDWAMGDLYQRARDIPGVQVSLDPDGSSARSYGARTSGQVLLYSPEGRLVFSGGITASRGHEGDNDGKDAILAYAKDGHSTIRSTPVFGCALGTH
jgi:hypothetical protein